MRLLHTTTRRLTEFFEGTTPRYAILSHTWGDEEVTLQDLQKFHDDSEHRPSFDHPVALRAGYRKIKGCCDRALQDGIDWIWIDTCCIDKTSSSELSEAINSMFQWYRASRVCYVYMLDVSAGTGKLEDPDSTFRRSRWFTRGWTLQELLAPQIVQFFDVSWNYLGELSMQSHSAFVNTISDITAIPLAFLQGYDVCMASIAQRMSWASRRVTSRTEDIAYCLLGIFDINMPLLYGEGKKAFQRLQEEIIKSSNDQTILAWGFGLTDDSDLALAECRLFADSPKRFSGCANLVPFMPWYPEMTFQPQEMTNLGLRLQLSFLSPCSRTGEVYGILNCQDISDPTRRIYISLSIISNLNFFRKQILGLVWDNTILKRQNAPPVSRVDRAGWESAPRDVYILRTGEDKVTGPTKLAVHMLRRPNLSIIPPVGFSYKVLYTDPSLEILGHFYKTSSLLIHKKPASLDDQRHSQILLHLRQEPLRDQSEEFVALIEYTSITAVKANVRCSIGRVSLEISATTEGMRFIHQYVSDTELQLENNVIKAQSWTTSAQGETLCTVKMRASSLSRNSLGISAKPKLWLRFLATCTYVAFFLATLQRVVGTIILFAAVSYLRGEIHGSLGRAGILVLALFIIFEPRAPVTWIIRPGVLNTWLFSLIVVIVLIALYLGY